MIFNAAADRLHLLGHVDDAHPAAAEAMRRILVDNCTPLDAWRCMESEYDLALCAIVLPGGSGLEMARAANCTCPGIRLAALTGYGMPDEMRDVFAAGFDAHLLKSVSAASSSLARSAPGVTPGRCGHLQCESRRRPLPGTRIFPKEPREGRPWSRPPRPRPAGRCLGL